MLRRVTASPREKIGAAKACGGSLELDGADEAHLYYDTGAVDAWPLTRPGRHQAVLDEQDLRRRLSGRGRPREDTTTTRASRRLPMDMAGRKRSRSSRATAWRRRIDVGLHGVGGRRRRDPRVRRRRRGRFLPTSKMRRGFPEDSAERARYRQRASARWPVARTIAAIRTAAVMQERGG